MGRKVTILLRSVSHRVLQVLGDRHGNGWPLSCLGKPVCVTRLLLNGHMLAVNMNRTSRLCNRVTEDS